jgi:sigma-B regulation protein RsbU (phosphoserine phosphatase)
VCGKGVYAATKTSMIKYVVRALVAAGMGPAAIVGEVNNMIAESGDPSDIVTLWVGCYDAAEETLTWANGGHPPGLLLRESGELVRLEVTGALLGAMHHAPYEESSVPVGAGDKVLLYTDGVTEARRGNIFFGEERVASVLAQSGSADQIARNLLAAVHAYVQGELRDDVAVLVVAPAGSRNHRQRGNIE